MEVTVESLDKELSSHIDAMLKRHILAAYGHLNIPEEDFNQVIDDNVFGDILMSIRKFYEFLGGIVVKVTRHDLYEAHISRYR